VLKLGVLDREQFLRSGHHGGIARLLSVLSRGRVSFLLLERPPKPSKPDSELFEWLMPYVRLSSGIYRTTYRGRFGNLDPEVNQLLASVFDSREELKIEDWAASACLTSSEWAESLFPVFPQLQFVASDILLLLVQVQDGNRGAFVFEPAGAPLQFVRRPFVIRMAPPEPWIFPLNYWLCRQAWRRWNALKPFPDFVQKWIDSPSEEALNVNGRRFTKLSLIHPDAAQLAQSDSRFLARPQSAFEPLPSPVHAIRTMNIFNRAYFREVQLKTGAEAVIRSLLPGGIWILGRTIREEPPEHEVTIFRKADSNRLEVLKRIGPGSEIEALVLSNSYA
jgi:hypothetical protein